MARKIWKFQLTLINAEQAIVMPIDSKVLCVQVQAGKPVIWVDADIDQEQKEKLFRLVATGDDVPDKAHWMYIGTIQLHGGSFVLHLFERL